MKGLTIKQDNERKHKLHELLNKYFLVKVGDIVIHKTTLVHYKVNTIQIEQSVDMRHNASVVYYLKPLDTHYGITLYCKPGVLVKQFDIVQEH